MRRITAVILACIMLLTAMIGATGCSTTDNNAVTMGVWLTMIDDAFGMDSYTSDEPYFATVSQSSRYFGAVQIAAEWDVISKDEDIDVNSLVDWQKALITLVNVGEFTDIEAPDDEKVNYGIEHFDPSIKKYWLKRSIPLKDATKLLATAQEQWAGRRYTEKVERTKFAEDVMDLSQGDDKLTNFTYGVDGVITIPASENIDLAAGDVFVLPGGEGGLMGTTAFKAQSVEKNGDNIFIKTSDDLDLYDIAEELYLENTFTPSMENAVIRDGNGNVIYGTAEALAQLGDVEGAIALAQQQAADGEYMNLAQTGADGGIVQLKGKDPKLSRTFEVTVNGSKFEIELSADLAEKANFGVKVSSDNMLTKGKTKAQIDNDNSGKSLKFSGGFSITDFEVTNKVDYKWFKLREALLRVDYKSKIEGNVTASGKLVNKVLAPADRNLTLGSAKETFLKNWSTKTWKDAKGDTSSGAKTIKIASIDLWEGGIARVCLDINFQVAVDGSISVTLTTNNSSGLEYKNGELRTIKTSDKDADVQIKAKIEATVGIGPALYVTGLKKKIIGLEVRIGLGGALTITLHLLDSDNHLITESKDDITSDVSELFEDPQLTADAEAIKKIAENQGCTYSTETSGPVSLHLDTCVDVAIYFILKLEIADSYAKDLIGSGKFSWEIFGEKNGKMFNIHVENWDWAKAFKNIKFFSGDEDQCTFKAKPFDKANGQFTTEPTDETTDPNTTYAPILEGDTIILEQVKVNMHPGEHTYLVVNQVPKGYSLNDLVLKSDDAEVAYIDSNGVVQAKKEGSTMITVETKDGKFQAYCAVTVYSDESEEFHPLQYGGNSTLNAA